MGEVLDLALASGIKTLGQFAHDHVVDARGMRERRRRARIVLHGPDAGVRAFLPTQPADDRRCRRPASGAEEHAVRALAEALRVVGDRVTVTLGRGLAVRWGEDLDGHAFHHHLARDVDHFGSDAFAAERHYRP